MITDLTLHQLLPNVFADTGIEQASSDVWQVDLTFQRGQSYLVEASSGRGKTSLCMFLYGLRTDYRGEITVTTQEGATHRLSELDLDELRQRNLAMMFQDNRLFSELTPVENCLLKNRLTNHLSEQEIRSMLVRLGLESKLDIPCELLSLGQQQRVAFVRMLCQPVDFYLLDEPVSHLDDDNARLMSEMLQQAQATTGAGLILTSIGRNLPYRYDHLLKL